jgi:hypothetical protein
MGQPHKSHFWQQQFCSGKGMQMEESAMVPIGWLGHRCCEIISNSKLVFLGTDYGNEDDENSSSD